MEFLSTPSARRATCIPAARRMWQRYFYPRPPRGGRRPARRCHHVDRPISIHALREEGDEAECGSKTPEEYFYPRPPRGGRRVVDDVINFNIKFLSTPSARRATRSSTASRSWTTYFYPRPPRGGRLGPSRSFLPGRRYFYPRPPRGGRRGDSFPDTGKKHFYPRPPRGGRRGGVRLKDPGGVFLSTPSARRATRGR